MTYYRWSDKDLKFYKISYIKKYKYVVLLYLLIGTLVYGLYFSNTILKETKDELYSLKSINDYHLSTIDSLSNVISIINESESFSEEEFIMMVNGLNLLFPEVVIAQSMVETGNYTSDIFLTAGNLFGMKAARVRPYTHYGEYKGHADYLGNWKLSVIDYALWQAREVSKSNVKTTEDYLTLLKLKGYAEDEIYIEKIRKHIKIVKTKL
jgi:uncharacterized FlgJ-related protein